MKNLNRQSNNWQCSLLKPVFGICCSMDHSIPGGFIPPCKILHPMGKEEQPQCTLPVCPPTPHQWFLVLRLSLLEPSEQKAQSEKKMQFYLKFAEANTEKRRGIKEVFFSSQSLACSLNGINACDKDTREGKTEGTCQRWASKGRATAWSRPLFTFNVFFFYF